MSRFGFGLAAALLLAAVTAGCFTSRVGEHWGEAYREDVARMIAHPDADKVNTAPVLGLDPATAEAVMESYGDAQARPKPASQPSIINIGR